MVLPTGMSAGEFLWIFPGRKGWSQRYWLKWGHWFLGCLWMNPPSSQSHIMVAPQALNPQLPLMKSHLWRVQPMSSTLVTVTSCPPLWPWMPLKKSTLEVLSAQPSVEHPSTAAGDGDPGKRSLKSMFKILQDPWIQTLNTPEIPKNLPLWPFHVLKNVLSLITLPWTQISSSCRDTVHAPSPHGWRLSRASLQTLFVDPAEGKRFELPRANPLTAAWPGPPTPRASLPATPPLRSTLLKCYFKQGSRLLIVPFDV